MTGGRFLAIGDVVTEPFIRLKDAEIHCRLDAEECEICMRWGDKIPYESATVVRAVGNAANAAVAASRLGLPSGLVSDIGDDSVGRGNIEELAGNGVDTSLISTHAGMQSNYHYVLWYGDERTILVRHEDYPYKLPDLQNPSWIYLSSLSENSLSYHAEIAEYLERNPEVVLAFQPGTFQMKLGAEKLSRLYRRSRLFFCNTAEARRILASEEQDPLLLLEAIRALGPEIAVVTDGPKGAYAADATGAWFMPPYPDPKPPLERTGAGDAFAATVAAALALGKSLPEALSWGPVNSMSVVQHIGAQKGLLSQDALLSYLANAPAGYEPRKIS